MKSLITNSIIAVVALAAGIWIGYSTALNNQLYFDAPAKLSLYGSILDQGNSNEYLKGQIIKQVRILEMVPSGTSKALLNIPIHREVKDSYQAIGLSIKTNKHYVEAVKMISTYNKLLNSTPKSGEN